MRETCAERDEEDLARPGPVRGRVEGVEGGRDACG